jgi:hypothetical protein
LAAAAIRLMLAMSSDPKQIRSIITTSIDETLNSSGSAGNADETLDAIMRETARLVIDQHLATIPRKR